MDAGTSGGWEAVLPVSGIWRLDSPAASSMKGTAGGTGRSRKQTGRGRPWHVLLARV